MTENRLIEDYDQGQAVPSPAAPWQETEEQVPVSSPVFTPTLPPLDLDGLGKDFIDPADIEWKRVSPKYLKVRMISRAIWSLIMIALACLPLLFTEVLGWWNAPLWLSVSLVAVMVVWQIWLIVIVSRQVRALGYSERAEHLLTRKGIMFRKVRAVPYGRIQFIDVSSGPVENMVGLSHLDIKTAGGASTVLPGLDRAEAQRLREILTDLSETKMVGL